MVLFGAKLLLDTQELYQKLIKIKKGGGDYLRIILQMKWIFKRKSIFTGGKIEDKTLPVLHIVSFV